MVMVVKKKGNQQKFNPNKLKLAVERAVREGYQRKHKLVVSKAVAAGKNAVKGKTTVNSRQIRDRVYHTLARLDPFIASTWRKYEHRKHR